jgi:hypothetical protein
MLGFSLCLNSMWVLDKWELDTKTAVGTLVGEQRTYLLAGLQTIALQAPFAKETSGFSPMQASLEVSKAIFMFFSHAESLLPIIASRPSHYVLMHNDFNFMQQKEVEELSYYLCHVHQGASCSVSIPTPIYCE